MTPPVHATAVARHGTEGWRGVLLRGASGAGKSDLALRLMAEGWRLVGDDYVHLFASGGRLWAAGPEPIRDRIEARGLGLISRPALPVSRVALVVDLSDDTPERLPEPETVALAGIEVPRLRLDPRPASACVIVAAALDRL